MLLAAPPQYATPATSSRAGVVYSATDEGWQWRSVVKQWINATATTEIYMLSLHAALPIDEQLD
mgnify:CR=1 FL=1